MASPRLPPPGAGGRLSETRDGARRGALHLEIAERLVPLDLPSVARPIGFGEVERRLLPAPAPEVRRGVEAGGRAEERRHEGEAKIGVLLPVPVGGKLGQLAKALLAAAERFERARL